MKQQEVNASYNIRFVHLVEKMVASHFNKPILIWMAAYLQFAPFSSKLNLLKQVYNENENHRTEVNQNLCESVYLYIF